MPVFAWMNRGKPNFSMRIVRLRAEILTPDIANMKKKC
jgi:hypothetical protein